MKLYESPISLRYIYVKWVGRCRLVRYCSISSNWFLHAILIKKNCHKFRYWNFISQQKKGRKKRSRITKYCPFHWSSSKKEEEDRQGCNFPIISCSPNIPWLFVFAQKCPQSIALTRCYQEFRSPSIFCLVSAKVKVPPTMLKLKLWQVCLDA